MKIQEFIWQVFFLSKASVGTLVWLSLSVSLCRAQAGVDSSSIAGVVFLDSITVTAIRAGWDLNEFILKIKQDQSLYVAFRNLRKMNYSFEYQISANRRKGKNAASFTAQFLQIWDGRCRSMVLKNEETTGPWLEPNGDYAFFSAKLADRLFLTHGQICDQANRSISEQKVSSANGKEKYINLLKRILFNPGNGDDIPLLGHEFELFDPNNSPFYTHSISQIEKSGQPIILIHSTLKKDLKPHEERKNIVRELVSYMRKEDNQIIHRSYHLVNRSFILDCDVTISFDVLEYQSKYYVHKCQLLGYWNIPGKKWENVSFNISIYPQP